MRVEDLYNQGEWVTIGKRPLFVQDGGHEIHPSLDGITFYFWRANDVGKGGENQIFVDYSGEAERAPWSLNLAGGLYNSFSEAKGDLREKVKRFYEASLSSGG